MSTSPTERGKTDVEKTVFWHRELPPIDAEPIGEHTIEAVSARVPGTLAHRDEIWERCYADLMAATQRRLEQEMARLGGQYAHVLHESIDTRHDEALREVWLHGQFTYVLYRQSTPEV
jgi:hypothetical protein